ncbi:DUF1656 domain-containing protein [Duganella callida]|uniref:DUF1656 domain-containing protein n=1 Tax=Duganella callida TaxID=2561932 RepID=A0A4Y9SRW4_9BURK|nr:DUF1656 domain-containing protein [Duganella callida]TFW29215.1 DUF1656 domain-containing protein [Duganella callida]
MPREVDFFGILLPGVLPVFLLSALLQLALDAVLSHVGAYRRSWHPALVRLCMFVCIFSFLLVTLYK